MSEFHDSITPPSETVDASGTERPIRMWPLMEMISKNFQHMNHEELRGALYVLGPMCAYLNQIYFEQKEEFDRKSLVKTIEELFEMALEADFHGGSLLSDGEDSE